MRVPRSATPPARLRSLPFVAAPLRFRRRYDPLLVVVDGVLAAGVAYAAYLVHVGSDVLPDADVQRYRAAAVGAVVSWVLLARSTGLYRRPALAPGVTNLPHAAGGALLVGAALVGADLLVLDDALAARWIGYVVAGLLVAGAGSRVVLRRLPVVRRLLGPEPGVRRDQAG